MADEKGESFVKVTEKMIAVAEKDLEKAKVREDWGRVLSLEGYINGMTQALANYDAVKV